MPIKTAAEFETYFPTAFQDKLDELEKSRKKKVRYFYLYLAVAALIGAWIFFHYIPEDSTVAFGLLTLWAAFIFFTRKSILKLILIDYVDDFKEQIIGGMVNFYAPGLKYDPDGGILKPAVEISNIFVPPYIVYKSDDYVEGRIGETIIQFSEVFIANNYVWFEPTFSGLFMIASFNKNFKGVYLVRADHSERHYGESLANLIKRLGRFGSCLMKMDNPEFQKEFSVYGTDEQEARYILTPAVMDKMLQFKREVGNEVSYAFARGKIFLAISTEKNLFDPPLTKPVDEDTIYRWNTYMHYAFSVVDEFNLNVRIWSKK